MLIDELQKSIKQLKQLDIAESTAQNVEKKRKNDSDYSALVSDFWESMKKISYASRELKFTISDETMLLISDTIVKLENIIVSDVVDEEELDSTKRYINKTVTPKITKDWKIFYNEKTAGVIAQIATIGSLVQDKEKITSVRSDISNASNWNDLFLKDGGENTRLELLKSGIDEVEKMEGNLNLSEEIRKFVKSVIRGKARVIDLTPTIIEWISDEDLDDKFVIDFKKT